jgi:type VI secretion system secreted protein VgrG
VSFQQAPPRGAMHVGFVSDMRFFKTLVPQSVILKDDDYDFKDPYLQEEHKVENEAGVSPGHGVNNNRGSIAEYGDYGKPASIGGLLKDNASRRVKRLAQVRAQEAFVAQNRYTGLSDRSDFFPGAKFALDNHEVDSFNKTFLLVAVEHEGADPSFVSVAGTADILPRPSRILGDAAEGGYRNRFRCIREEVPFRPQRTIAWPRLTGVMSGIVDTDNEDDDGFPQLDEMGRYKVRMMFDLSGRKNGEASTYLRMSLPMAGENQGLNFPLQPGTEVLWSCFGGNPDEPVIVGALPNAASGNVVTRQNTNENRIVTRSGIHFVMVDG